MEGVADMSMTSLKIGPERNEAIDFSIPFIETGITIIVLIKKGVISATAFLGKATLRLPALNVGKLLMIPDIQYGYIQQAAYLENKIIFL